MILLGLLSILIAAGVGFAAKVWWKDQYDGLPTITTREYVIGLVIISFVVVPITVWVGAEESKKNLVTFNEYWNGWELDAIREDIQCTRDGPCRWEYDCDPYLVTEFYDCNCDDKGNCDTCTRLVTKYHSCPYVTVETNYFVQTTLGEYTIAKHQFPVDPQKHRWRRSESIPSSVIERAGTGEPPFWFAVWQRIATGSPGPVSVRREYDNYVLASDRTILRNYSQHIERFKNLGVMPAPQSSIHDWYWADKVHFVGTLKLRQQEWQQELGHLNSALGKELQGDVQVVIINHPQVNADPDTYALALRAYWMSRGFHDRDAFAKNGIGVVLGTADGETVAWARAFTGMPVGNEDMAVALQNGLRGLALNPSPVIGHVRGEIKEKQQVKTVHSGGVLERVLWGMDDSRTKFQRVSMSGDNKGGGVGSGFLYLSGEIQPTTGQSIAILVVAFVLSCLIWIAAVIGDFFPEKRSRKFPESQTFRETTRRR